MILPLVMIMGCSAFKESVGDYIKESVVEYVESDLDKKLAVRDLSIAEIKSVLNIGSGTSPIKEITKDFLALEAEKIVTERVNRAKANLISKDQFDTKTNKFWNWMIVTFGSLLLGIIGKYIRSLSVEKGFKDRLIVLEKLLGQDLDGDGSVGNKSDNKV